MSYKFVIEGSN